MGAPYKGVLYAGLMITAEGPKLIEYNVRFGDPECQVLMLRLMSDLVPALIAARDGMLKNFELRWYDEVALTVVMAAKGYPGDYAKGSVIGGLDEAEQIDGVEIFHAGTASEDGRILANGGRVLDVTAAGKTVAEAQRARLCGRRQDRLAGRLLPPRHRRARCGVGKAGEVNTTTHLRCHSGARVSARTRNPDRGTRGEAAWIPVRAKSAPRNDSEKCRQPARQNSAVDRINASALNAALFKTMML